MHRKHREMLSVERRRKRRHERRRRSAVERERERERERGTAMATAAGPTRCTSSVTSRDTRDQTTRAPSDYTHLYLKLKYKTKSQERGIQTPGARKARREDLSKGGNARAQASTRGAPGGEYIVYT